MPEDIVCLLLCCSMLTCVAYEEDASRPLAAEAPPFLPPDLTKML
jgi:hypothetical protein